MDKFREIGRKTAYLIFILEDFNIWELQAPVRINQKVLNLQIKSQNSRVVVIA